MNHVFQLKAKFPQMTPTPTPAFCTLRLNMLADFCQHPLNETQGILVANPVPPFPTLTHAHYAKTFRCAA